MNKRATRRYDDEFKKNALELVKTSGKSALGIAEGLGINPNVLYYWIKREDKINNAKSTVSEESNDMKKLRRELEDVRLERDILKKAVGIFSKRPE